MEWTVWVNLAIVWVLYSGHKPFIRHMICKYFFLFCKLPFYFVDCFFWCAEAFLLDVIPLIKFAFVVCAFGVISKISLPEPMSKRYFLMFYSFRTKERQPVIGSNGPWRYHAKWNKSYRERQILYNLISRI